MQVAPFSTPKAIDFDSGVSQSAAARPHGLIWSSRLVARSIAASGLVEKRNGS